MPVQLLAVARSHFSAYSHELERAFWRVAYVVLLVRRWRRGFWARLARWQLSYQIGQGHVEWQLSLLSTLEARRQETGTGAGWQWRHGLERGLPVRYRGVAHVSARIAVISYEAEPVLRV